MLAHVRQSSLLLIMSIAVNLVPSILAGQKEGASRLNVETDIDLLKRVIVLEPGDEMRRITVFASEDHPSLPSDAMQPGAVDQHRQLVTLLETEGVEVLEFADLLNSAIVDARKQGEWRAWLQSTFPDSSVLWENPDRIDASDLIGRGQFFYHYGQDGTFSPLLFPMKWMFFMRDVAIMTPRGLVLANFANYDRAKEIALVRFAFAFAPELSSYPVKFDAEKQNVFLQGGDLMVLDEHTLILGVGSLSETEAAVRLAQELEMNVLGVSMPPLTARHDGYGGWTGVHLQFLHLDTFFTLVDRRKALAVPYVLESMYSESNPMVGLLESLDRSLVDMQESDALRHKNRYGVVKQAVEAIGALGWVTEYEAGTGKAVLLNKKLVDVMRERGYKVIPVGGKQGSLCEEQYLLERVLFELTFQASNVVALEPGVVIAYEENSYTVNALKEAGVKVLTFPGSLLAMWHGGPHCLTLPLERATHTSVVH
jgi:arginine deiminase